MLNRDWTDKHPNEPCAGCQFFIIQRSECTYKSKRFFCWRDEYFATERERQLELNFGDD